MALSDRNAAIFYSQDGFQPESKGLNGRRVAGQSFLRGFLDHADVDEFVSFTGGSQSAQEFGEIVRDHPRDIPHRATYTARLDQIAPVGTIYYASPIFSQLAWARQCFGANKVSLCGITHTTATKAIVEGLFNLRVSPQMEWDAVVCTSRAVHASTVRNFEIAEDYLQERFGSLPARPQMPIIPLGIDCAKFAKDDEKREAFRKEHGWGKKDVVVSTLARLYVAGKFDPIPLFIALQKAQERLGKAKKLHFVACGIYSAKINQEVYEKGAKRFMPDVSFTHVDGSDMSVRQSVLSASDIFTFAIDNIQETFGLAPIEAMAAGLPVVSTDWDGMRDTVSKDVGFLIPTRSIGPDAGHPEGRDYHLNALTYTQYISRLSNMTPFDIGAMSDAFEKLARSAALRKKMGAAAKKRAVQNYDWSQVIPQMQDLWAELSRIRTSYDQEVPRLHATAPQPMDLFASYPSDPPTQRDEKFRATKTPYSLNSVYGLRGIKEFGNPFEKLETLKRVYPIIQQAGPKGISINGVREKLRINPLTIERCMMFFLKYGFVETMADEGGKK